MNSFKAKKEGDSKIKHLEKHFESCKVVWKIVNFCFAIKSDDSCIQSPDLTVGLTKWRITVNLQWNGGKDGCISLCLERLPDRGRDIVWVNWEIILIAGSKQFSPVECSFFFDRVSKKDVNLQTIIDVLANLPPFEADTLKIECNLIIRKKSCFVKCEKAVCPGLRSLSDDLKRLFKQGMNEDVKIKIMDKEIRAHKAILIRNKVLRCLISKAGNKNAIELENLDYKAVSKFISFIYSGNMESILRNPSISMYKCIDFFDCEFLMDYYAPEILNIHSKFETQEHEFHCAISGYSKITEDRISSPVFKELHGSRTWQLHLHTNKENYSEYISIFAENISGKQPQYLCLEFAIENCNGETFYPNRILRHDKFPNSMGFKEFIKKVALENTTLLMDDTLKITFKVRTSEGSQKTSFGTRLVPFIIPSRKTSYETLSHEMQNLLNEGKLSDITLYSGDERIKAHKCILSARSCKFYDVILQLMDEQLKAYRCVLSTRSHTFSDIIQNTITKPDLVALPDIKPDILHILLDYIYSGVLKVLEFGDLLQLYEASHSFAMRYLREECVQRLLILVDNENRVSVLNMAKTYNDDALFSAVNLINFD